MPEPLLDVRGVCLACARRCDLHRGPGLCGVRRLAADGSLVVDGSITHAAVQPIEQKPLYHYRPGIHLLTVGSWGCGTRCLYCRNAEVALARRPPSAPLPPALLGTADGIAFSFNEPLVRAEQVAQVCGAATAAGREAVVVTSGWATRESLDLLLPVTTAWRVDVKAASAASAERVFGENGAPWQSAFGTLRSLAAAQRHVEVSLTYSPDLHDADELRRVGAAVADSAGPGTAMHLQPLLPAHRMKDVATPTLDDLLAARALLHACGLHYVYVHLLGPAELRATRCICGASLVQREVGRVQVRIDAAGRCCDCGAAGPIHVGAPEALAA